MAKEKPLSQAAVEAQQKQREKELADAASVDVCHGCEMRGQGGSYIFDPKTGKRVRVSGPKIETAVKEQAAVVTEPTQGGAE